MKKTILTLSMFVFAVSLLKPSLALADTLSLSLNNPVQNLASGETVTFDGTIDAPITNAAAIFLNSDSFSILSPLVLDDSDFFSDAPLFLNPGDSYTGALFTVMLPAGAAFEASNGSFDILGGSDGSSLNDLAGAGFQIASAIAPTPEAGTVLLLGTGFAFMALAVFGKRPLLVRS